MYDAAFKIKEGPVPNHAMSSPERPGPTRRPALKFAEFKLTAFAISLLPTISLVNA